MAMPVWSWRKGFLLDVSRDFLDKNKINQETILSDFLMKIFMLSDGIFFMKIRPKTNR